MPYARVGVIPQPTQKSGDGHQGRSSRKKGITMEDLKKQTALRLAQEQQNPHFVNGGDPFPSTVVEPPQLLHPHRYRAGHSHLDTDQHGRQMPPADVIAPSSYHSTETPLVAVQQAGIVYPRSASAASNGSSFSDSSTSNQNQQHQAKPKLPHGLTVQELKEMTKARLQAEAFDRHDQDHQRQHAATYPQKQQYSKSRRDEPFTHQDHRGSNRGYVQSPLPLAGAPGFQSLPSQGSLSSGVPQGGGRDSWHQSQHAKDTWETCSVASHNSTVNSNSEYLGCESPYTLDEYIDVPFLRSRSYPSPAGSGSLDRQQFENSGTPGSAYFDSNMNRRMATALSPRPGLSHLDEHRPSYAGVPDLGAFEPTSFTPLGARGAFLSAGDVNRSRTFSGSGLIREGLASNRPRTFSAPSVPVSTVGAPGIRVSTDPFVNAGPLSSMSSSDRLNNNSDFHSSIMERLLGASSSVSQHQIEYSSVFRSPSRDHGSSNPWSGSLGSAGLQQGNRNPISEDEDLAQEFGSVLNLSGIDDSEGHVSGTRRDTSVFLFPSGVNEGPGSHLRGLYGDQASFVPPPDAV